MRISVSSVHEYAEECEALVQDYYKRTNAAEGVGPININWDAYKTLEDADQLMLVTAVNNETLVGFALYIISHSLHWPRMKIAKATTLATHTDWRGKGIGRAIVEAAMPWLMSLGCTHIAHDHRTIYKTTPLFEKMGWDLVELCYMKELN